MEVYREIAITAIVTILLIIVLLWMYDLIYGNNKNYYEFRRYNDDVRQMEFTSQKKLQLVPWGPYREFSPVRQYQNRNRWNRATQIRGQAPLKEIEYTSPLEKDPSSAIRPTSLEVPNQSALKGTYSPFLAACWECDAIQISRFINAGVDTRQMTPKGETGLCLATYRMAKGRKPWNPLCLHILVNNGCSINEPTKLGNTALHVAVKQGHVAACKWLLEHGASIYVENKAGWRPAAVARAQRREEILSLILQAELLESCQTAENNDDLSDIGTGTGTANAETSNEYHSALCDNSP